MGAEPFIGQIQPYPYNFAPRGWATCSGQLLPINQYTALFSLLGTTYGGDGRTTFGVPDLRGRSMIGIGQGPGLSNINLGDISGTESVTLIQTQMPAHTHIATATSRLFAEGAAGNDNAPDGNLLAIAPNGTNIYTTSASTPNQTLSGESITTTVQLSIAGGSQPVQIRNPYLGLNICIALEGLFPSRN